MSFENLDWGAIAVALVTVIFSVTVHELGHAYAAWKLGDDTAARLGRLTLNPLPLIKAEPMGMIVAPLIGALSGFTFAWASTPVNLVRVHRKWSMRQANFLISLAGPLSNLALALLSTGLLALVLRSGLFDQLGARQAIVVLLITMLQINLTLFVFNLIPIHPLDGFSVLFSLLPASFDGLRRSIVAAGNLLLLVLFVAGGRLIAPIVSALIRALLNLVR